MSLLAIGAILGGGLSLMNSRKQNKDTARNLKRTVASIKRGLNIQLGQYRELKESSQREFGLQMTGVRYEALKTSASTANDLVERNISGNTASRIYNQSFINQTMAHNALAKAAEDNFISFGVEMDNARLKATNLIDQAQAQASANMISPLQAFTSALSGGFQGAQLGSALGSFNFSQTIGNSNFANPSLQTMKGGV